MADSKLKQHAINWLFVITLALLLGLVTSSQAAPNSRPLAQAADQTPPGVISYQGMVNVNGSLYSGQGLFKFALVNSAGTAAFWSHDGTGQSTAPYTPTGHITLTVSNGLFSVGLGDTSITGQTQPITASHVVTNDRALRVWFSDGVNGWERLTPDAQLTSAPYALNAAALEGMTASSDVSSGGDYVLLSSDGDIGVNGIYLTFVNAYTQTSDGQANVCFFSNSDCTSAQSGNSQSKLKVFGGINQTRRIELYQVSGGHAYIDSTYTDFHIRSLGGLSADILLETAGDIEIPSDNLGIGISDPSERLQVAGNIAPAVSGTHNLGTSALSWNEVHYKSLVSHSLGQFNDGVQLDDGSTVSCTQVISALRAGGLVMENGLPHLDYSHLPSVLVKPAIDSVVTRSITSSVWWGGPFVTYTQVYSDDGSFLFYDYTITETLKGEMGADLDAVISVILCAGKELRHREKLLEQKTAKLENRQQQIIDQGLALEQRVTTIEDLICQRFGQLCP